MKRIIIYICLTLVIILCFGSLFIKKDVTVANSSIFSFENGCEYDVTIVANKLIILDRQAFAEEMVQRCIDNTFDDILFSYDLNGYPSSLHITVYINNLTYKWHTPSFDIDVTQDNLHQYNLKDNPEAFHIEITKY